MSNTDQPARPSSCAAGSAPWRANDLRLAFAGGVGAAATAGLLEVSSASWKLVVAALLLGICLGVVVADVIRRRRLSLVARACRAVENGDLRQTVPEQGDRHLVEIARTINGMAADFQEVLLLFEHLTQSVSSTAEDLEKQLMNRVDASVEDRKQAADVVSGLNQLQVAVREYKYFRISLQDGRIVDTGIEKPSGKSAG